MYGSDGLAFVGFAIRVGSVLFYLCYALVFSVNFWLLVVLQVLTIENLRPLKFELAFCCSCLAGFHDRESSSLMNFADSIYSMRVLRLWFVKEQKNLHLELGLG